MKKIYIVLSQNYTLLSLVIKTLTKEKYSHVSLSFNKSCTDMYSMGRKYTYFPFIGEFKHENIYKGVFILNPNAEILIYELEVTSKQFKNIKLLLNKYGEESRGYNFLGLILALFNKKIDRKKYYCSEFLYKIFSDDRVSLFIKTNNIVKPMDFLKIENIKKVYEGKLVKYREICR